MYIVLHHTTLCIAIPAHQPACFHRQSSCHQQHFTPQNKCAPICLSERGFFARMFPHHSSFNQMFNLGQSMRTNTHKSFHSSQQVLSTLLSSTSTSTIVSLRSSSAAAHLIHHPLHSAQGSSPYHNQDSSHYSPRYPPGLS